MNMNAEWKPLSASDGKDVYDMLQEMPHDENGFMNNRPVLKPCK